MPKKSQIKPAAPRLMVNPYGGFLNSQSFSGDLKNALEWLDNAAYVKLVMKGKPISYKSVRATKASTGKMHFYNPLKEKKILTQWAFSVQYLTKEIIEQPVIVCYFYSFAPPKSMSKTIREELIKKGAPYLNRKDTDNMCKFYNDCLQGIVVQDDKLIWKTHVEKIYDSEDKVTIYILK